MARIRFNYDAVVKDLFQKDRPTLLRELAGGAVVQQFLNVELTVVEERVADLLALLSDGTILHLDFQSSNHRDMAYREGIYGLMVGQKYRKPVRQAVIYMGERRMRMADRLDLGGIQVAYRLLDIREWDAVSLMESDNPGDQALALLAGGGVERMRDIVDRAIRLPDPGRQRALTQMAILSGLRGASERLTMEFRRMGITVDIEKNAFLRDIRELARAEGIAEGKAEGIAEGKAEGMLALLHDLLEAKFGEIPRWAAARLSSATPAQLETWARKVLTAATIEGVLGRK